MKNFNYAAGLLLVAIIAFSSCKKDDTSPSTFSSSNIVTGQWHVSLFKESSSDHTVDFSGYAFTFDANGVFTATINDTLTTGTWSFDDSGNEFHLNIGTASPLTEISKGWIVLESTSVIFRLGDDSGNNEELDFSKI